MKTVFVIIDGLSDEPIKELGKKTPLEVAYIPNIQYLASNGNIGRIKTTFKNYPIESMVCIMGLMGYEPSKYYPFGRASFEAMAKGITLYDGDLILRCNIVTANLKSQILTDFTSQQINDMYARKIISKIKLPYDNWELYPGQSYRNILIIRGANVNAHRIKCFEPHMNIGKKIYDMLPIGFDQNTSNLMKKVGEFLIDTQKQIKKMAIPESKASMLWVWSPSKKTVWPSFKERTGLNAGFIGGLDFIHGLAAAANIDYEIIPGATGYIDTNYKAKADYAIRYLNKYDFILVHINATDEEAHLHNYLGKIKAIENVDELIISPIVRELNNKYRGDYRIAIMGDHMTKSIDGKHGDAPVPYVLFGKKIINTNNDKFCEKDCNKYSPNISLKFLKKVISK